MNQLDEIKRLVKNKYLRGLLYISPRFVRHNLLGFLEEKTKSKSIQLKEYSNTSLLNVAEYDNGARIKVRCRGLANPDIHYSRLTYEIVISDCNNTIVLHGALKSDESYSNFIHKVNTIIKNLEDLKDNAFGMRQVIDATSK